MGRGETGGTPTVNRHCSETVPSFWDAVRHRKSQDPALPSVIISARYVAPFQKRYQVVPDDRQTDRQQCSIIAALYTRGRVGQNGTRGKTGQLNIQYIISLHSGMNLSNVQVTPLKPSISLCFCSVVHRVVTFRRLKNEFWAMLMSNLQCLW